MSIDQDEMRRIVVVGTCGSGKTTLATQLAQRIAVPHVELDALHWGPNWTPVETEVFRKHTEAALAGDAWTVDGNYSAVRDIVWARADTVVWLRYSLWVIYRQLTRRTLGRVWRKEVLWNGNREEWHNMFARDSLFIWAMTSNRKQLGQYPVLFEEYGHLKVVILHSPREMHRWLADTFPEK